MKVEELFLCECGSPDHMFYIKYDDEWKDVFMYAHLRKKSFWNRLKYGIKYIFGYQSRYGAFDEIILRNEDLTKLQRIIDKAKARRHGKEGYMTEEQWKEYFKKRDEESITITIPKDLKGTDTDGGVVGDKGEQPTNKNFKERYENIAKSDWFKKTHKDISIGEEQPTEEEMVGMGGLGKVWREQAIINRLDKIIELLQSAILVLPKETYIPPIIYKNPLDPDPNTLGGWTITANTFGLDYDIDTDKIKKKYDKNT